MKISDLERATELYREYNKYAITLEDIQNAKLVKDVSIIDNATRHATEIVVAYEDDILSNSILASLSAYYQNKQNEIAKELKEMGVDM